MTIMNKKMANSLRIPEAAVAVLSRHPEVLSAYQFGSTVLGAENDRSDVDIAVRIEGTPSAEQLFELRLKLMDELEVIIDRPVDVVIMNRASLKMLRSIFTVGAPLFIRDPEAERHYKLLKQKEYFDFRHYIDRDITEMKRYFGATNDAGS